MVTFFVVIISNILIGTIFYLIISLKLEKSASDFYAKKMRKEMDDIIREFNQTAERNITILENRISIMKKIMEKSGIAMVDFNIADPEIKKIEVTPSVPVKSSLPEEHKDVTFTSLIKDGSTLIKKIISTEHGKSHELPSDPRNTKKSSKIDFSVDEKVSLYNSQTPADPEEKPSVNDIRLSESEIAERYLRSDDKQRVLADLYTEGYSIEFISKSTDLPIGEVKLILNLNGLL